MNLREASVTSRYSPRCCFLCHLLRRDELHSIAKACGGGGGDSGGACSQPDSDRDGWYEGLRSLRVLTRLKLSGYVRRMRGASVADTARDMSRLCDLSCVISGTQDSQKR